MVCLSSILSAADFLKFFSFPFFFLFFFSLFPTENVVSSSPPSLRARSLSPHPSAEVALRWLIDG